MKFVDAQSLREANLDVDICIVGSGPAGLTLARELAGTGHRVCILESGGFEKRRDTEKLNNAEYTGSPYQNARHTRRRQVGGTSHRWSIAIGPGVTGVRYAAPDPIDFEPRDWMPESGWSVSRSDLTPYYTRAQEASHLGPFEYGADYWETSDAPRLPLDPNVIESGMYQFGARSVFALHPPLDDAGDTQQDNVTVLYNATVLEVETNANGTTATGVRVLTYNHRTIHVHAVCVVLAMGGIETVRLLLLSSGGQQHPDGLGNDYDQLGRYFMDHPQAHFGTITPKSRDLFDRTALYDLQWKPEGGYAVMGMLKLSETALRRERLPNYAFLIYPRRQAHLTKTFHAYHDYTFALRRHYLPPHPITGFAEMMLHAASTLRLAASSLSGHSYYYDLGHGGWSYVPEKDHVFDVFEVITQIEQLPHPDSRITLGSGCDQYSQPKAHIHWEWTEADTRSVRQAQTLFGAEIERAGLGQARFPDAPYHVPGSHHHMGGARMNADPREGVVDADCKVHGVDGLYVASSAVFPTGGYANPTLTIIALAIRLADHLKANKSDSQLQSTFSDAS